MRILHVADTHLGYSAYHKVASNGLNQREMDVYNAFKQFIDYAIETKPDLILHCGDLFDSVRPTNRAISFALQQLLRLSEEDIPIVIISGNHETPKLRETGSVFRIFEHIKGVHPVYKGKYEQMEFSDVIIHAIPHCHTGEDLKKALESIEIKEGYHNIQMLHVGIIGVKEFRRGDFNEQVIPTGYLKQEFSYIALGHYHKETEISKNAYYAGSTEHFSFKEAGEEKGFFEIEINSDVKKNFIPLKIRPMIDLGIIDCSSLSSEEITKKIEDMLSEINAEGKILRLLLKKIDRSIYRGLDFEVIKKISSPALYFELTYETTEHAYELTGKGRIGTLVEEWREFVSKTPIDERMREEIEKLALSYLSEVSM
ncbi:MAG: exonuclease SbcCD subunit D [Thermoplasmata archaeon]|nr:MAG: exonuclease SbcCD subunit D [Thermoplasmata archaeon]